MVIFLGVLAEASGDKLPTHSHTNLPEMTKLEVYDKFAASFYRNYLRADRIPCKNYFYRVWKEECSDIKTQRHHGFTVCSKCEQIRSRMADNLLNETALQNLQNQLSAHLKVMAEERRSYTMRMDRTIKYPRRNCSIVVDGADQKSYGLPHFIFDTKSDKGHKMKVKCIGVLEHLKEKSLTLFTMTEEFESGANHVLEFVHRVLNCKKALLGKRPQIIYVQVDNCTRENKNRYFMAYFEMFVGRGVLMEVQISFLPVGHTHTDIDQSFSCVVNRLRVVSTVTMSDLITELRHCYTPRDNATELLEVGNFSGWCEGSSKR